MGAEHRPSVLPQPRALVGTGTVALRERPFTPVRRRGGSLPMDVVPVGAWGPALTDEKMREQASVRDIKAVIAEKAARANAEDFTGGLDTATAEDLWRAIEQTREWVAAEEERIVAGMPDGTPGKVVAAERPTEKTHAA